jgi:hypothetical protein
MRDRAVDALAYVQQQTSMPYFPDTVINGLITQHGATRRYASGTYVLRCAGIAVSSTANMDGQLLQGWRSAADLRLSELKLENFDD